MVIKAVFFDCFGVLVTDAWLPFKERHFGHDPTLFEQASEITRQANRGLIGHQDFISRVAELSGVPAGEVAQIIGRNVPNEQLFDYIRELKKKYKVGFLSNIAADYLDRMFTPDHLALFDKFMLSFESGYVKPEPEAYQEAADQLHLIPEECVMIDDQERNVLGARVAGMQAILYESVGQVKKDLDRMLSKQS